MTPRVRMILVLPAVVILVLVLAIDRSQRQCAQSGGMFDLLSWRCLPPIPVHIERGLTNT